MATKSQHIREFLKQGLADIDIAQRVGCGEAYVRAVRQRTSSDGRAIPAPSDINWEWANRERVLERKRAYQKERLARDPEYKAICRAATKRWVANNRDRHLANRREWWHRRRAEARAS